MASGRKPAIVRKLSRDWVAGYVTGEIERDQCEIEVLDQGGKVVQVELEQVKWVCYLRDLAFGVGESTTPERLLQKRFRTRPRIAGLWLRVELVDQDLVEGIATNDASLIKGTGLLLIPPDTRSNTQRIFIPYTAIENLEVVGLIGAGSRRRAPELDQPSLFAGDPEV